MRDNKANRNKSPNTSAHTPAARHTSALRQGAAKPTSLAERREKAVIRLPEERRRGTKYQVIRGQYLRQANKKENLDNSEAEAIKKAAAKQEEKQAKAKHQTAAATTVKTEKEKSQTSSAQIDSHNYNDKSAANETSAASEAKENYAKSEKAAAFTERLQANIELSKAAYTPTNDTLGSTHEDSFYLQNGTTSHKEKADISEAGYIPPNVTCDQALDHSVKKGSVYSQGGTASERAASYKEKADFYLKKMKKNAETGKKEVNPDRDKDLGALYKKAYKLAHKEKLLGKKNDTLFDKAQSAVQLKSEVDNVLNKDNTGEAVVAAAAIPITHAATKAVRKLADKNRTVNVGKTGFELAAKVTAEVSSADSVGEATVNAAAAIPKYIIEKEAEKTVRQVIQAQHDRKIEAQKERLREQQEKAEKRAQQMKKENMQRKMKADLYKSEHGMGSKGNVLQRMKSAVKAAIDDTKKAIKSAKSLKILLFAGGSILPIIFIVIIVVILVMLVLFPFFYTSKDGKEEEIEDSTFDETVLHYYDVMDGVVDDFNAEIDAFLNSSSDYDNTGVENPEKKAQYDSDYAEYQTQYDSYMADYDNYCAAYPDNWGAAPEAPDKDYWYSSDELGSMGMERGPIFEGFVMSDESDAARVPKGKLYDEMLCTIATYNTKLMTRSEAADGSDDENEENSGSGGSSEIIFMNDENVAGVYGGSDFWEFNHWEEGVDCPSGGNCCSKTVTVAHYDEDGNITSVTTENEDYCPTHYIIKWEVKLDFDLDRVWESYQFDDEDEKNYNETKKNFDDEKEKAEESGISFNRSED
ncbi:MAG: hypothetical protein OSJ61_10085 [Lachnospiraceae bacterium]|nr:hypothetical protein [Lachnospiraceae bacterium]